MKRFWVIILMVIVGAFAVSYPPRIPYENRIDELSKSIHLLCNDLETTTLNRIVPFEWDTAYFFEPGSDFDPQLVYDVVGHKWKDIYNNNEDRMSFVFLKDGRVVCDSYDSSLDVELMVHNRSTLFYKDEPRLMITSVRPEPTLTYFDTIPDILSQAESTINPAKGIWDYDGTVRSDDRDESIHIRMRFAISKEGLVYGQFGYEIPSQITSNDHLGSGYIVFSGILKGNIALCDIISSSHLKSTGYEDDKAKIKMENFEISFRGTRVYVRFNVDLPLLSGQSIHANASILAIQSGTQGT